MLQSRTEKGAERGERTVEKGGRFILKNYISGINSHDCGDGKSEICRSGHRLETQGRADVGTGVHRQNSFPICALTLTADALQGWEFSLHCNSATAG